MVTINKLQGWTLYKGDVDLVLSIGDRPRACNPRLNLGADLH